LKKKRVLRKGNLIRVGGRTPGEKSLRLKKIKRKKKRGGVRKNGVKGRWSPVDKGRKKGKSRSRGGKRGAGRREILKKRWIWTSTKNY